MFVGIWFMIIDRKLVFVFIVYLNESYHLHFLGISDLCFPFIKQAFATRDSRPMSYNIIHYEESENETIDPSPAPLPEYLWEDLGWTECNRECDGGEYGAVLDSQSLKENEIQTS